MTPASQMTPTQIWSEVSMMLECYCECMVENSPVEAEKYRAEAEAFAPLVYAKCWTKTRIKQYMPEARQRCREG